MLGNHKEASDDVELAHRAGAQLVPGSGSLFVAADENYVLIHEAGVSIAAGRSARAIELLERALARVDGMALPIQAWFLTDLASAYVQANEVERAGPALSEALRVTELVGASLLQNRVGHLVRQELAAHGDHPAIKDLAEQLVEVG
jgi:hypothetical protein